MTEVDYDEEDCLPLSGIQHFAFCKRQFALIHIERLWLENTLTFEGRTMHDRVDDPFYFESRGTLLITRSVPLLSRKLGLYGVADVVEFHLCQDPGAVILDGREGQWQPFPVEYKRGQPKPDDRDVVQLVAQAICLEEMLQVTVHQGALFYGRTRRRQVVHVGDVLRSRVRDLAHQMHGMYDAGQTPPPPDNTKQCQRCSLKGLCLPKIASRRDVRTYIRAMLKGEE